MSRFPFGNPKEAKMKLTSLTVISATLIGMASFVLSVHADTPAPAEGQFLAEGAAGAEGKAGADSAKSEDQPVTDATITAKIKAQLLVNDTTSGFDINVDTERGAVTLSGSVASREAKDVAEHIAENTEGVQSVKNQLEVVQKDAAKPKS